MAQEYPKVGYEIETQTPEQTNSAKPEDKIENKTNQEKTDNHIRSHSARNYERKNYK